MSTAAIVLSGGSSRRMGSPKTAEPVGGRALLARVTDALGAVDRVVVVGPVEASTRADVTTREQPPGAGPVAALAQGIGFVDADTVYVLAGDLPFLTGAALAAIAHALTDAESVDAAVAVDDCGRDQYLLAAWRGYALRQAVAELGPPAGLPLRRLYGGIAVARVELAGDPPPWWDCDTPADLRRARAAVGDGGLNR